jgi:hypothetical protein
MFETRAVPAQRKYGIKITGPFLDVENPNKFVFLRSFPSLEERDRMKEAFYSGKGVEERVGRHRDADVGQLRCDTLRDITGLRV